MFQNNDELRPGGGFVTAYANLNLLFGIPTSFSFHNSYEVDTSSYVTPPYPQEELLKNEWYQGYTFRDANWDPNFPDAAKTIVDFYQKKFPSSDIDGVVVMNFKVIEDLLKELGSVSIKNQSVDSKNLFSFLEFQVGNVDRHNLAALASRKDVLKELAQSLTSKMFWSPFRTRNVLSSAIDQKDLYFWFKKPALEAKVIARGWGNALTYPGAITESRLQSMGSDFLGLNLANLGSKKADRYLLKNAEYYVDLSTPVPTAHLKVELNFPGKLNSYSDPYRGYLRVILPVGYTISYMPDGSKIELTSQFQMIGTVVQLTDEKPSAEWTYDYTLPRNLFSGSDYRLRLTKQSADRTNYLVAITGPRDSMLESDIFDAREDKAFWRGSLLGDTDLTLHVQPDTTPPYVLEQKFDTLSQISLLWSEPMDDVSVNNPANYTIQDINAISPTTDTVKIESVSTDQAVTRLSLSGITSQPLEQYRISMKGIRDRNKNAIQSDPKEITVVQR
ncbi:DUF4012 domain-containing protein [Candidatus Peregrinibacteria bacterium]|nr:DUF4012 domain-containing protein [Candidatus Peregrinibacteria bacterium]